jgi:hypothetical protein
LNAVDCFAVSRFLFIESPHLFVWRAKAAFIST